MPQEEEGTVREWTVSTVIRGTMNIGNQRIPN